MRRSPSETLFSVVFWILCSWLPSCLADWQVSHSISVVQLQQNICHQNDCEHEWQSTLSPKKTWGIEQNSPRRDEYRQPGSQVLCLTALGIPSWPSWIQLVVWSAANEVDAISVWCVRDVSLLAAASTSYIYLWAIHCCCVSSTDTETSSCQRYHIKCSAAEFTLLAIVRRTARRDCLITTASSPVRQTNERPCY